jgi:20S proteasome alpha/beta subunit
MSLLVCLLGTDGLVLATDSRGTFGDPRSVTAQNDLIKKLYLANKRVGILVAGAGDLGSTVVSGFLALSEKASLPITELTMALHRYARAQFGQWFQLFTIKPTLSDPRPARPDLNFIVAGFELNDEPKIYRMSSSLDFAPMLHNYGFGLDGVAQYALYLLNRLYDPNSVMEDLECLAAYVITETASQDGKVGGPVQMATVTARDSHILNTDAVEDILLINRERSQALRKSFLKKEYGLSSARPRKVKPAPDLIAPSETADLTLPVVVPIEGRGTTPDALSSLAEEANGEVSTGVAW